VLNRRPLGGTNVGDMNDISAALSGRPRRAWLPPAIALVVTITSGLFAVACVAAGALTDSGPYPRMGWLTAGVFVQAILGVTAIALLIASFAAARGRLVITRLGWAVVALSVAAVALTSVVGNPAG